MEERDNNELSCKNKLVKISETEKVEICLDTEKGRVIEVPKETKPVEEGVESNIRLLLG